MKFFKTLQENIVPLIFLGVIFLLNWVIPETARVEYYHTLRELDLVGTPSAIAITILIAVFLTFVAAIGWHGINSATEIGIPKLEIATANFTKTLVVVASISAVLGTIGSSGGEIASAFFEGLRILPDIVMHKPVDSAGIFSVYVANFSGVVNASAAAFAGIVLIYMYATKKMDAKDFSSKIKELGSKSTLVLATGLFFLYFVQSAVTWDGRPTLAQSSIVVGFGVIIFMIGFSIYQRNDAETKPKSGRDYFVETGEVFGLHPKKLGEYLAVRSIGTSQNLFVLVPKFMLSLAALISMLIIPIEFMLVMLGFSEVVLAFAVAFITSIVEILLVIAAGEMAVFLLLGSNVVDVIFGLFFGEVVPQMFGRISYHPAMPAVSMYSALFALATLVGVLLAYWLFNNKKYALATLSFVVFILGGGIFYNLAIFMNGIDPMNAFIQKYLANYEYPIFYAFVLISGAYIVWKYQKSQQAKDKIFEEVLESMTLLKDYYGGAIFVVQIDGDSLKKHLGRVSYIVRYLIDAEKYLGGDGNLTLLVENTMVKKELTKENYPVILSEIAHNPPASSKTILQDTLKQLLDKKFVADISLANTKTPILFISFQSDLLLEDIKAAKKLLKNEVQHNKIVFEVGCFDSDEEILKDLEELNEIYTENGIKTNWVSTSNIDENIEIEKVLETMFDRFSDYIEEVED